MSDLTTLTIAGLRDGLNAKEFSAQEVTDAYIQKIDASDALNTYILKTPDHAKAQAKASDERLAKGEAGPLEGIPLGMKDLFCTKDIQTTAASKILTGFAPRYESTVSANLARDGAVMLGKLNLDEFAMGSSNETSAFGPVVNPWRRTGEETPLTPGGSSGGSSASVA
ncbi:MAG: amidase, partial [Pseudomonadota bacterium]